MDPSLRFRQRLSSLRSAATRLREAVELSQQRSLTDLEKQGLIQAFEFTHELAWNVMKDWFEYQGTFDISGSRDATRKASAAGLVSDGIVWMEMIRSRNESSHTYNLEVAERIARTVEASYWPAIEEFLVTMGKREAGL